jgi:hypothetical protein
VDLAGPRELLYASVKALEVAVVETRLESVFEVSIEDMQIDNQLPNPPFPVLLGAATAEGERFLHLRTVRGAFVGPSPHFSLGGIFFFFFFFFFLLITFLLSRLTFCLKIN